MCNAKISNDQLIKNHYSKLFNVLKLKHSPLTYEKTIAFHTFSSKVNTLQINVINKSNPLSYIMLDSQAIQTNKFNKIPDFLF